MMIFVGNKSYNIIAGNKLASVFIPAPVSGLISFDGYSLADKDGLILMAEGA